MLRPAISFPLSRSRAYEAALRGDDQVLGVGVKRFAYEALRDLGAVGVGSVDKVHAELDRPPQHCPGLLRIFGLSPDPLSCQAHRAKPQTVHVEAIQSKSAGVGSFF